MIDPLKTAKSDVAARTFASREDAVRESVAQTGVEPTEGIEVPW